jgi:hypothetical protein
MEQDLPFNQILNSRLILLQLVPGLAKVHKSTTKIE